MIKSLLIKNFQSHKDSILNLSDKINIISGNSNCGKTAILRSLNWLFYNRPSGWNFKSNFCKEKDNTEVTIDFDNNKITRFRSNSKNQYILNNEIYEALGNKVPDEIENILNLNELNIQNQFDKHFLLTDSAGEIGKTINQIVNLDNIDRYTSLLNSKINNSNKEVEFLKKETEEYFKKIKKYEILEQIEPKVNNLNLNFEQLQNKKTQIGIIDLNKEKAILLNNKINELNRKLILIKKIVEIEKKLKELNYLIEKFSMIKSLCDNIKYIDKQIKSCSNKFKIRINITKIESNLIKYTELILYKTKIKTELDSLKNINIAKLTSNLQNFEQEFNNIINQQGCPFNEICRKNAFH